MNTSKGKDLGELLLNIVPKYKDIMSSSNDGTSFEVGSYLFFNDFSSVLANEIIKNENSDFVNRSFEFINKLSSEKSEEVVNLLKIGILEILYTSGIEVRKIVFKYLNDTNKEYFESFSNLYS